MKMSSVINAPLLLWSNLSYCVWEISNLRQNSSYSWHCITASAYKLYRQDIIPSVVFLLQYFYRHCACVCDPSVANSHVLFSVTPLSIHIKDWRVNGELSLARREAWSSVWEERQRAARDEWWPKPAGDRQKLKKHWMGPETVRQR